MNAWCDNLVYVNKKGEIKYDSKPDFEIYPQFLQWLREEHSASEPANADHIVSKVSSQVSAGGYASGRIGYTE